jgi:hypothetical protein
LEEYYVRITPDVTCNELNAGREPEVRITSFITLRCIIVSMETVDLFYTLCTSCCSVVDWYVGGRKNICHNQCHLFLAWHFLYESTKWCEMLPTYQQEVSYSLVKIFAPFWHNIAMLFSFLPTDPCHSTGRLPLASDWRGLASVSVQSMRDLWRTKWHWQSGSGFPLPFIVPPMFHTHQSSGTSIMGPFDAAVPRDSISPHSYSRKKYWSLVIVAVVLLLWVIVAVVLLLWVIVAVVILLWVTVAVVLL